jgi:hypothetical protein
MAVSPGRWFRIGAVLAAVTVVVACGAAVALRSGLLGDRAGCRTPLVECAGAEFFIRNDRPAPVHVRVVDPHGAVDFETPAGALMPLGEAAACRATLIVASEAGAEAGSPGAEIARLSEANCRTVTWILGADGTARLQPGRVAG